MKRIRKHVLTLAGGAMLSGCANVTILDTEIAGKCMKTVVETHWTNPSLDRSYSKSRLLVVEPHQPKYLHREVHFLEVIAAGTRLQIADIERWDLPTQNYVRVTARFLEGEYAGEVFDLSACVPFHPRPRFIIACTMHADQIRFNPEYLRPCEED